MTKKKKEAESTKNQGDTIRADIKADKIEGQVAIGKDITQKQQIITVDGEVTEQDRAELKKLISNLKEQIQKEVPPEMQSSASERIDELEEAVNAEEPDMNTMDYVKNWFLKNLPSIAGSVTSLVIHPIVGKLVKAAGDLAVDEFDRRFGVKIE